MIRPIALASMCGVAAVMAACVPAPAQEPPATLPAPDLPQSEASVTPDPLPQVVPVPAPLMREDFAYSGETEQGGWIRGQAPSGTVKLMLGEQDVALEEEGRFFLGFDRDTGASVDLVATMADGSIRIETIAIRPRDWQLEHINAPLRPGSSSEAYQRRRAPELDAIWDARIADSPVEGWRETFIWPATGRISGRFGSQRIYQGEPGSYHSGLDIAGGAGAPVIAPASGKVTLATSSPFSLEGNLVIVDHGNGLNSAFLHLSRIDVEQGQMIKQGDPIGLIGASGRVTGPHLHWSIKWHLARLDPLLFVGPMP